MSGCETFKWARCPGQFEVEEATLEEDFNRKFTNCKKNPGHISFIPIKDFSRESLPVGFRDSDLCDMVRCLGDQTVKLEIYANRPSGHSAHPLSDTRDRPIRCGTGRIRRVAEFIKGVDKYGIRHNNYTHCPCWRCCGGSGAPPSEVWWQIQVLTARHLVPDGEVASRTTCVLFYDSDEDCGVSVEGVFAVYANLPRDSCEMVCVTCDRDLASRLEGLMAEYDRLWPVVHNKFESRSDVDRLTIIVSHPHGQSKRVSIGRWIDRWTDDADRSLNLSQFTYNASTCPGSSGALVYIVGLVCSRLFYHHAHSGSFALDVGQSGVGEEE